MALGELALSPDGSLLVYTRRTVRGNEYETHLWLVPLAGGRPRQLTRGAVNDAGPQFTPDGRRVAFLRDEKVWAIDVDGGEAEPLATLEHGVSAFRLSPDGRRIALVGGAPEPHLAVGGLPDDGNAAGAADRAARLALRRLGDPRPPRPPVRGRGPARGAGRARSRAANGR